MIGIAHFCCKTLPHLFPSSSALRHLLYSTLLSVNKQLTLCLTEAYMTLSDCLSGRQSSASLHRAQAVSLIPSPLNHSRYSSQHQYIGPLCACVYHQSFHTFSKKLACNGIGSQLQVCLKKQKLPRVYCCSKFALFRRIQSRSRLTPLSRLRHGVQQVGNASS